MAMCTTIVAIRKKNIRHLYYGDPAHVVYRTSADYPNLQQLKLLKDDRELRESILRAAKQNYAPRQLEPAPAYRAVTASQLDGIVRRLYYNRVPGAATAAAAAAAGAATVGATASGGIATANGAGSPGHATSAPPGGPRRIAAGLRSSSQKPAQQRSTQQQQQPAKAAS